MTIDNKNTIYKEKISGALDKLDKISSELKNKYVERNFVIDNCIKALITGQSVLLIGPPGTAKSAITDDLCKRIENGNYFSWLLNRTSDPSEILGPFSLKAMENDKFLRVTKSKLPEAEIVFLDEIFKCNEPTLNILLPLINEKIFYNDGVSNSVPLVTLFAASNEFPDEDSLMALYDRLMFRLNLDYVQDCDNKLAMYKGFLNRSKIETTMISLDEIHMLSNVLNDIELSDEILIEYIKLMNLLFQEGIIISDRRQNETLKVLKANAMISRKNSVDILDFPCLKAVLWSMPDEIEIIDNILKEFVLNPFTKEYNNTRNRFNELSHSAKNITDSALLYELCESVLLIKASVKRTLHAKDALDNKLALKYISLEKDITSFVQKISQDFDEDDIMYS
jgi:MoxR-like ATPase